MIIYLFFSSSFTQAKVDAQKDPLAAKAELFARPPGHHLFSPHHRPPDLPPSMQSALFPHGE